MLNASDATPCPACGKALGQPQMKTCKERGKTHGITLPFLHCGECGMTHAPTNTHAFSTTADFAKDHDNLPESKHGRVGTEIVQGREYFMAMTAAEILAGAGVAVDSLLVFGAGLSRDHMHIGRSLPNARIGVCDMENFQQLDNHVPLHDCGKFSIVVACEVIEHFTDIGQDFSILLSKLAKSGLAILSTNISDATPLERLQYPFTPGHVAYYSGKALQLIANRIDPTLHLDFRLPRAATAQLGPRKRYIFVYREATLGHAIAEYFSRNAYAPSEPCIPLSLGAKVARMIRRATRARM